MHWSPDGLSQGFKERIGQVTAAASLSLPPDAMFSIMFTKHLMPDHCSRQEEFSTVRRKILDGVRAWSLGLRADNSVYPERFRS